MAKMGRKLLPFNWSRLDSLCQRKMDLSDCAEIMQVSEDTIRRRIKAKYKITFAIYQDKKMSITRLTLVEKALEMADRSNVTMLIFCLKNLCGWSDKYDNVKSVTLDAPLTIHKMDGSQEKLGVNSN